MSFAEQLAARAAETQSHSQQQQQQQQQHQQQLRPKLKGTPPRPPGKIINSGGGSYSESSSPSLFAEQLKKQKQQRRGTKQQHSDRSITSTQSEPRAQRRNESDGNKITKVRSQRSLLTPSSCAASPSSNYEDEEDEYSSVGFSLMDAAPAVVADEGDDGNDNVEQLPGQSKITTAIKHESRKIQPLPSSTSQGELSSPSKNTSQVIESPPKLQQQQREPPFQNNLSPIISRDNYPQQQQNNLELQTKLQQHKLLLKKEKKSSPHKNNISTTSKSSLNATNSQNNNTPPNNKHQETISSNDSPTNAIFGAWAQIESLKQKVREAEKRATQESQRAESASYELRLVKERQEQQRQYSVSDCTDTNDADAAADAAIVVGDDIVLAHDVLEASVMTTASSEMKEETGDDVSDNEQERRAMMNDTTTSTLPSTATAAPPSPDNDEALLLQWTKRALEAEERLAREVERLQQRDTTATTAVASVIPPTPQSVMPNNNGPLSPQTIPTNATATPPPAPTPTTTTALVPAPTTTSSSLRHEESDIIRLKNAEIDVLRHQIHRLEHRIQQECERNEEYMLRSSSYHSHHHHPPLDVVSECIMSSNNRTTTSTNPDMDDFRLLRSEIRSLQYQLRTGKTMSSHDDCGRATYSTTGESTLSSLDGNENHYEEGIIRGVNEKGGEENDDNIHGDEEEEEDMDENNMPSHSSMWGLCCIRRSMRGYGRVMKS